MRRAELLNTWDKISAFNKAYYVKCATVGDNYGSEMDQRFQQELKAFPCINR